MLLLIDCNDSFTWNIVHYIRELGKDVHVCEVAQFSPSVLRRPDVTSVVLSPGPGHPSDYPELIAFVQKESRIQSCYPILGVCLGHQILAQAFGANIVHAVEPMHGKISQVTHDGDRLYDGLSNPLKVCRYHSLVVDAESMPAELVLTGVSESDEVMSIQHQSLPMYGVQFHPEAILSEFGKALLGNFLKLAAAWHASRD